MPSLPGAGTCPTTMFVAFVETPTTALVLSADFQATSALSVQSCLSAGRKVSGLIDISTRRMQSLVPHGANLLPYKRSLADDSFSTASSPGSDKKALKRNAQCVVNVD